jgi:ATP-dependent RNA helicase HelY
MVRFCPDSYPVGSELKYSLYFEKYSFPLSTFQKFAIEAIVEGNHSLSCVPTGSGKTMPALFAIDFFTSKGKKIIYTSPIKALSNQKYYEFTQKFPEISIGLLTGDIKINPEADVLIMTAEILQNTLYRKKQTDCAASLLMFDMDFENELGCVVQDEIHMINDEERGHVWESIILLLPKHIQMVMLSATLDKPEKFAGWIETRGNGFLNETEKNVAKEVFIQKIG